MKSRVRIGTFARQIGLTPCFIPTAASKTVLRSMGGWIEDYDDNYPHSGLNWRSPRVFIEANTETA